MTVDWPQIPRLGLGTWGRTGDSGLEAILAAIEIGYRHLDTAQSYGTESVIGEALARTGMPRDAFFITTKIADTRLSRQDLLPSLRKSLERLRMDRVDLTLIHWPSHRDEVPFEEYIEALIEAKALRLTAMIGVSNFPCALVRRAVAIAGPGSIATNQVEMHPYLQNRAVAACCAEHHVTVTAYRPLGEGRVARDAVLRQVGARHGIGPEATALAWLLQRGAIAIPASRSREHLAANWRATGVTLSVEDMASIHALDRGLRLVDPGKSPAWD